MAIARSLFCCQRFFLISHRLLQLSSFPFSTPTPAAVKAKAETSLLHPSSFQSLCPNRHHETLAAARTLCRQFSSSQSNTTNSPAAFDYSSEEEEEASNNKTKMKTKTKEESMDKSKLPPPYDPFNNNRKRKKNHHYHRHTIEEEEEEEEDHPKDLQAIFHKMRTEGLVPNAIKMFDALSKDGLTHEALELFSLIKDKGSMPDVVAHTAVVEAYANAGQPKEALRVFMRMLASGVRPNAYTYSVLIRGLAADSRTLPDAKRHLLGMMDDGIRPNAATYTAVFEAFFEKRLDEAHQLLEQMRDKGFVPDERAVRDHLAANKRGGQVFRTLMNLLFDK